MEKSSILPLVGATLLGLSGCAHTPESESRPMLYAGITKLGDGVSYEAKAVLNDHRTTPEYVANLMGEVAQECDADLHLYEYRFGAMDLNDSHVARFGNDNPENWSMQKVGDDVVLGDSSGFVDFSVYAGKERADALINCIDREAGERGLNYVDRDSIVLGDTSRVHSVWVFDPDSLVSAHEGLREKLGPNYFAEAGANGNGMLGYPQRVRLSESEVHVYADLVSEECLVPHALDSGIYTFEFSNWAEDTRSCERATTCVDRYMSQAGFTGNSVILSDVHINCPDSFWSLNK